MAFVRMKGIAGLLYVPDENGGAKKHPCRDCFHCQWCSDNKCGLCLHGEACSKHSCRDKKPGGGAKASRKK